MSVKNGKPRCGKPVQKRRVTDAFIHRTFKQLGLTHSRQTGYTNAQDFAKGFQRCTLLKAHNTNYSAHAMV